MVFMFNGNLAKTVDLTLEGNKNHCFFFNYQGDKPVCVHCMPNIVTIVVVTNGYEEF